ncbi:Hypothetical predicted protein, partial [Paramuricea clavata]
MLHKGKPLTRKTMSESTELIREKREELDEDDRSSEMQKFMLDLSSKEDMSRLRERFKSGTTQGVENDAEYRRLKRFSIHDSDDDVERRSTTSGKETMHMRSSRESKAGREKVTSSEESPSPTAKATSKRSKDRTKNFEDQLEHLEDNMESLAGSLKRSEKIDNKILEDKSKRSEDKSTTNYELSIDNFSDKKDYDQNLHDVAVTRRDTADSETGGSRINSHHIVGRSWELIHHYPTAYLPSLTDVNTTVLNNTTMHSEYLGDNIDGVAQYDADDVTQYERAEKSRRKPRVSLVRPVRSIETDYEVRELSEINNRMMPQSSHEESGHVVMVNTKAIKRDGYIGCFIDQHPNRDLKKMFTVNNLTPVSCRSVCKEKGHVYAGVQYGYLCHCGDDYGKYGEVGEHECNSACLGDDGKKCGGFWRNSVYTSETPEDKETPEDGSTKREARSHIDRVIPIPQSEQEETPVRQEITVYLRSEIPKTHQNPITTKHKDEALKERPRTATTNSKLVNQPTNVMQAKKRTNVNSNAYLHPQTGPTEFVPSNVVLRTLTSSTKKRKYTGFIKLKQNWDDGLQKKTNPKTLILAGNIETAFSEMFAKDPQFEKAEILSLREAEIRDNPDTVHKVLVEFALMFKKGGRKKDEILRSMVENNSRVGEMPVFVDSLDIKEYKNEEDDPNTDAARAKEKRQGIPVMTC